MKIETYKCDCCRKETSETDISKVSMPIVVIDEDGYQRLIVKKMDICIECANKFVQLYYKIANEHNHSGIKAIMMERSDKE